MPKPFISYDQQIALLKSKHLIISDEDAAKRVLAQIGYFSLIGGYKHPFKNKTTKSNTILLIRNCLIHHSNFNVYTMAKYGSMVIATISTKLHRNNY